MGTALITDMVNRTLSRGGCTYSLVQEKFVEAGDPLYVISLHKSLEVIIPLEEFREAHVQLYLIDNKEALSEPNRAFGTWVYEGNVYLDVSTVLSKYSVSLHMLMEMATDQLAAWDMEYNTPINLKAYDQSNP